MTSAHKTGTYITNRREPVDASYMESSFMFHSDLRANIEMDIRKSLLPRRNTADLSTDKTIIWSLNFSEITGHYCELLLVVSGQ